jgi:hypothetical protein
LPGHVDRLGGGPEERQGQLLVAAGQRVPQGRCLQRGHGHTQCICRVCAADRVTEDEQPGREAAQLLIAPANVGRKPVADDIVERFGVADGGKDVGWGDGLNEGEEAFGVGRRVVSVVADHRQNPPVPLLREQHETGGPARLGTDGDHLLSAQRPGPQPQVSSGVLQVDRELLFWRWVVADRRQPCRHPAAATGRVEHQVGVDRVLGAAGSAVDDPHPGDAVLSGVVDQTDHLAPVDDRHRG